MSEGAMREAEIVTEILEGKRSLTLKSDTSEKKVSERVFTIKDVKDTMKKKGWMKGAQFQENWFNGKASIMSNDEKIGNPIPELLLKGIVKFNVKIDTTTVDWNWFIQFERVKEKFTELKKVMKDDNAKQQIVRYMVRKSVINPDEDTKKLNDLVGKKPDDFLYKDSFSEKMTFMDTNIVENLMEDALKGMELAKSMKKQICPWKDKASFEEFHYNWQFKLLKIGADTSEKLKGYVRYLNGKMDDFDAAFFGSSINAGISKATVSPTIFNNKITGYEINVLEVVFYGRDTFDFNEGDQYLGNWNFDKMLINEDNYIQSYVDIPIYDYSDSFKTLICIRNRHYNEYRNKYGMGQDCITFTNPPHIEPVSFKFTVELDQVREAMRAEEAKWALLRKQVESKKAEKKK